MSDQQSDRREFLATVGLLPLLRSDGLAVGGDEPKLIPDAARILQPSAADLGTNVAAVEQIAATCQPLVFPIGRQIEFNETFRTAACAKVREVLSYEPPRVDFKSGGRRTCGLRRLLARASADLDDLQQLNQKCRAKEATIAMQDEAFAWLDEKLSHRR